jgi:uncharacterized protein YvpB
MPTSRRHRVLAGIVCAASAALGTFVAATPVHAATSALIPAPLYGQTHSLDCEAAALQIALAAKGMYVSQDWILGVIGSDRRAPVVGPGGVVHWGDPYAMFVGNVNGSEPGFTGYGVYDPPVAVAAERAGAAATALENVDPQVLYQQVLDGNPAVVWVVNHLGTTSLRTWSAWDGRIVPYSVGEHAMTLVGVNVDDGTVTLDDPGNASQATVIMQKFENSFASFGRMAVVVRAGYTSLLPRSDGGGYLLTGSDGGVSAFGDATSPGSLAGLRLNRAIVGAAPTADGKGLWFAAADGGVFTAGDAPFYGSMGGVPLNQPVVGIAATADGGGYWLVAADGGIFAFGDARFYGSTGGMRLNAPVAGIARTVTGHGYWLVASDGGIFSFGDARFHGSMGGSWLARPMVGIAATPSGGGYWTVASDGGIFSFGDARFYGSTGATPLNRPITAMAAAPKGNGYWLVAADGGVFSFGSAQFYGSAG